MSFSRVAFIGLALVKVAAGQTAPATLEGVVRTIGGVPIAGVRIATAASAIGVVSDSAGRYTASGLTPGPTRVTVRRLGYDPVEFSIDLVAGKVTTYDITLETIATLPAVDSRAPEDPRLSKFLNHRASAAGGTFIVRADIERRHPQRLSDLLRYVPGVTLGTSGRGQAVVRMSRAGSGNGDCPIDYWVDGMRVQYFNIDDIPPRDVEAIEIYQGLSALPPEYNIQWGHPECGTIAIWTRSPG